MGTVKQACTFIPRQTAAFQLSGVHPSWEMHPDYVHAIRSLDSFNLWVCEVVLPIAFQWIEEHKNEVYESIPDAEKDDVGVVVARAFEIIKELSAYQAGLATAADYEQKLADGTHDPAAHNPVWTSLCDEMEASKAAIKGSYAPKLMSTLR